MPGLGGQTPQVNPGGSIQTPNPGFTGQTPPAPVATPFVPARPKKRRIGLIIGIIVLVLLLITAILLSVFFRPQPTTQQQANSQFNTVQIPLDDFLSGDGLALIGTRNLTINGRLEANDAFIISPSGQPTNATAGQIYFDQTSNELGYFNGSEFIQLPGDIPVGTGIANTDGALSNSGVLSLQGQTGALTITSGGGIAVDGTTLTNTGVLSLGGATGELTLGSGLALTGNELRNSGVNSLTSGSVSLVVNNDGAGNLTISDVGGGSGTVTSSGGTTGRIAKFTGVQNIEDSLLSETGTTITVNGDLSVTGTTTLTNPLTVGNGGTGATSLASNGVVISHGASAFTSVAAGGAGQCLISTVGAPTWSACPGGGGVTSLNSLTGALTLANSTGLGSTITIDDASTSQKGIAQFDATNFSAVGGIIDTIQDISTSASPTFASQTLTGDLAVNGGDITSSGALNITPGGTLVVGATSQTLTLQGGAGTTLSATSGANTTTLTFQAPGANVTYRLPTASAGTYDVCSTAGNCAGVGGGVTTAGGTVNRLAKFTAAQGIGNSTISDDGTNVTTTVDLIIQGGDVTVGVASTQTGTINLAHSGSGFLGSIVQGPLTGNRTYTLPNADGEVCLTSGNCSGSGSSNTLQAAYAAGNIITTTDARDIDIVLANTATDSNFDLVVADGSTGFVSFTRANGAGTSDPAQMLLVDNLDIDRALPVGIKLQSSAGGMTTGIDATDTDIGVALAAGTNTITGTNFTIDGNNGTLTLQGTGTTTFTTPVGSNIATKVSVPNYAVGSGAQIIALGLTSGSNSTARAISLFDARTGAHQPTLAVFNPAESSAVGFTWNGSDTIATLQTTNNASGNSAGVTLQSGTASATSGDVVINSGAGTGANSSSGAVGIDSGARTGSGTAGVINIGLTNASAINLGPSSGSTNITTTVRGQAIFRPRTDAADIFRVQDAGGTTFVSVNSTTANLVLGNSGVANGRLQFAGSGGANTIILTGQANPGGNRTITLPDATGTVCIDTGNCTVSLQGAYTGSSTPATVTTTDAKNVLFNMADTATDPNFLIDLQCDTSCSTNGRFAIQDDGTDILTASPAAGGITIGNNTINTPLTLNSGTGAINIGTGAQARAINMGTGAADQDVTIGSASTGSSLALNAGSGNATLNATAGSVTLQTTTSGAINIRPVSADSTNIVLGTVDNVGTVLVLDEKTGAGDPSAVAGGMYYNSSMNRMRCYYDSAWRYCNEYGSLSLGYNISDDFVGWDNSVVLGERNWGRDVSGSGATVGGQNAEAGRPGVLELDTGTSTTVARAGVYLNAMNHEPILISGSEEIEFAINIPTLADGTNDFNVRAGLCDNTDGTDCNSGIYVEYDRDTSANWIFATSNVGGAGSRTKTTSSTAVTTGWHRFKIVVNSAANSVSYFMDGVSLGAAITTQIPTTTTQPAFIIAKDNPTGAAARVLRADYFQVRNNVTSLR